MLLGSAAFAALPTTANAQSKTGVELVMMGAIRR